MTIIATDNGIPPMSATASLIVNVVDANDNDPVFSLVAYEFQVEENQKIGAFVGKIAASDADLGDNAAVRYSLFPSNTSFVVNPSTGKDCVYFFYFDGGVLLRIVNVTFVIIMIKLSKQLLVIIVQSKGCYYYLVTETNSCR